MATIIKGYTFTTGKTNDLSADHLHQLVDNATVEDISDADISATNIDGVATTPSLRTIGTGTLQACSGNDVRLSNDRVASGLRTASGVVVVASAIAPIGGQVLQAVSGTLAQWGTASTTSKNTGTGTVSVTQGSNVVTGSTGSGAVSGTVTVVSTNTTVTGSGTAFTTDLKPGYVLVVGNYKHTIVAIASDTSLTVDTGWEVSATGQSATYLNNTLFTTQLQVGFLISVGSETHKIASITSASSLTTDINWSSSATNTNFTWQISSVLPPWGVVSYGLTSRTPDVVTGYYDVLSGDMGTVFYLSSSSDAVPIGLVAANEFNAGNTVAFIKSSDDTNPITIYPNSTDTINGQNSSIEIKTINGGVLLQSDGSSNWIILAQQYLRGALIQSQKISSASALTCLTPMPSASAGVFGTPASTDGTEVLTNQNSTPSIAGTGTVSTSNGSKTVTGVGTKFKTELQVGYFITINSVTKQITSITSDKKLTADSNWGTNSSVTFLYGTGSIMLFTPMSANTDIRCRGVIVGCPKANKNLCVALFTGIQLLGCAAQYSPDMTWFAFDFVCSRGAWGAIQEQLKLKIGLTSSSKFYLNTNTDGSTQILGGNAPSWVEIQEIAI